MMFSPGPKETGSDTSANSSRSSSVRNSKNLTSRSVSSITHHSFTLETLSEIIRSVGAVGAKHFSTLRLRLRLSARRIWRLVNLLFVGGASGRKWAWHRCHARSGVSPVVGGDSWLEDFDVDVVNARVGKPDVLGRCGGEIQLPTTRVRPTVGHGHNYGSITVADQQLRTERQVRRSRRVLAVGLEDVPTHRQVTLQFRSVPAGQLGVGQGVVLECGQRYGESASHQEHLEKRFQESPSRSLAQQAQDPTALQSSYKRLHISFCVYL